MIKRLVLWSAVWLIIVGSIAWATAVITGNAVPTFISVRTITYGSYTHDLYVLDVKNYLQQLQNITEIPWKELSTKFPEFWKPNWDDVANPTFLPKLIYNIVIWYVNFLIWWFNLILITPLKLALYPIEFLITLLGININVWQVPKIINIIVKWTPELLKYW